LFVAGNLQQVGLVYTTASKAAFLTAMYIVLVPILGLFIRHKTHWNTWVSVAIAVAGLYLLSVTESLSIEPGDLLTIIGAFFWAGHILVVDASVAKLDSQGVMKLCIVQFLVAGILAAIVSAVFEIGIAHMAVSLEMLVSAAPALLYVGIMSTGIAYTTQALGQKLAKPATASIVMSMEAVFGAIGGVLLLGESLTTQETIGAALLFAAVILTQIEFGRRKS
jgi:drug/metabolite transporter (DMT)-like permease